MADKYCTNCGTRLSAETAFCPQCGTKQDLQNYSAPSQQNMQNYGGQPGQYAQNYQGAAPQYPQGYSAPAAKKRKAPLIIAICAAVMAVVIGAVVIGVKIGSSGDSGRYDSAHGENTYNGDSSSSGGGGSSSGGVSFSGNGGTASESGSSFSDSSIDSQNTWNLSPGEASVTITDSNGSIVSTTQNEAAYVHSSGLYGSDEIYFQLGCSFSDTDRIILIMDILEDYCQEGLSLSSRDFDLTVKMGVLMSDSINGFALYNTYEHPQMIGNGSFRIEEYSANSTVFYIKADVVYEGTVYTLEGYGCADRMESDEPLVLTDIDRWAYEEQNGTCPTCHGSGTCQVCFGLGKLSGETCQGCFGSGRCWSCGGTGRSY